MKTKLLLLVVAVLLTAPSLHAQGTAFTYQGRLADKGSLATGLYDLRFEIYNALASGSPVGSPLTNTATAVTDGFFTVTLDFGPGIFTGAPRWLEIGVTNHSTVPIDPLVFTTLTPRQPLTPSPYAILAGTASRVADGAVDNAALAPNAVTAANIAPGQVVKTLNGLSDHVTLIAGSNVTVTTVGTNLQISSGTGNGWTLAGNNALPGQFLGTRNDVPLELQVNNQRALRLEPNGVSPNLIGGFSGNQALAGVVGATISGGGGARDPNRVTQNYGTVGGGIGNEVGGLFSVISGGYFNTIEANAESSTIAGGANNSIGTNADYSTIAGGYFNTIKANTAHIAGGSFNTIEANAVHAAIGGGHDNAILADGYSATVSGGARNVASGPHAIVPGGTDNTAAGGASFAAGYRAKANHDGAFVWSHASSGTDFSSTGSDQFLIRAAGGVGIGTVSPVRDLDVRAGVGSERGSIHVGGTGLNGEPKLVNFGDGDWVSIGENGEDDRMELTAHVFVFRTASAAPELGRVGIGTTNPEAQLHVETQKNSATDNTARFYAPNLGPDSSHIHYGRNGDWYIRSAKASGKVILQDLGGNVGIGTSTPATKLDVRGEARVSVLTITGGADLAEPFQMSSRDIPQGAVVVIDEKNPGQLKISGRAYDQRVAGIVSGANGIKPGITLHQEGALEGGRNVALTGRVYVLADARDGAIAPGDLLTSSDTPGHAMKVTDSTRAQGAILGKAMGSLDEGRGMVLVLVSLQ